VTAITRVVLVHVRGPLLAREAVPTAYGYVAAEVGDFIVSDAGDRGNEWPLKPAAFGKMYEVTDYTLDQDEKSERPAVTEFHKEGA